MNKTIIANMDSQIKKMGVNMNKKFKDHPDAKKVLLMGITGSGKSSVQCILSGKNAKIEEGPGKKILLKGKYIISGCTSGTKEPNIDFVEKIQIWLCDCPGFEDTEGNYQEIINAFADNLILESYCKQIKVLLVVQASDFDDRGKAIQNSIQRIKKMFHNIESHKEILGIIITKGDPTITGRDYIDRLNDRPRKELKEWIEYYSWNDDQIFTFPQASRENIGEQYEFDDYQSIINFITKEDYIELEHTISLNEVSSLQLTNIKITHVNTASMILQELYMKISSQFKGNTFEEIDVWLNIMHKLLDTKITKTKDVKEAIIENLPNYNDYEEYYVMLEEFEMFDDFIDKVFKFDESNSSLQISFNNLTHSAIRELERKLFCIQKEELTKQKNQEMQEKIDFYLKQINLLQKNLDSVKKDNKDQKTRIENLEKRNKNGYCNIY